LINVYLILVKKYFMSEDYNSSFNETRDLFYLESRKLQDIIDQALKNLEKLSLSEIIQAYYQVINVISLMGFLKVSLEERKKSEESNDLSTLIQKIGNDIDERFDGNLHLLFINKIRNLIEDSKNQLKEMKINQREKTKKEIENQAEIYEKLRRLMSTREFVDQYDKGLNKP